MRKLTPRQVALRYGVSAGTVIDWCRKGQMPAVDVSSATASRQRWRMSDDDIEVFEARRENRKAVIA